MSFPAAGPGGAPRGHRWDTFARYVIAYYGGVCHLCDHGGARQVDHLEAVTERPELAWVLSNCRPAHGAPGNRCPVCHLNCNQIRGGYSVERARRIIAERAAAVTPPKAAPPDPDAGRDW